MTNETIIPNDCQEYARKSAIARGRERLEEECENRDRMNRQSAKEYADLRQRVSGVVDKHRENGSSTWLDAELVAMVQYCDILRETAKKIYEDMDKWAFAIDRVRAQEAIAMQKTCEKLLADKLPADDSQI